ncbi:MAG TPA: DnaJ domain-containing protein [Candidatus Hydrogenedentes bacterium]|nr:DnaJ domain-containing protein [Candidatus Hydrogenedentota bacterium]
MMGLQEFLVIVLIIILLSWSGLWPVVIRGLRELRGEHVEDPKSKSNIHFNAKDIDLSFRLLGLSPSAPWEEIERAYRQKAKIHHPDRGGDEDTMRALNEAYSLIKKARGK